MNIWMVQLVYICMYVYDIYIYTCTLDYLGGFFLFLRSELKLHTFEIGGSTILYQFKGWNDGYILQFFVHAHLTQITFAINDKLLQVKVLNERRNRTNP